MSDDIYDYHGSNVVSTSYYSSPTGIVEINPYDSDEAVGALVGSTYAANTGSITDLMYEIVSYDGENPMVYTFKIQVWAW